MMSRYSFSKTSWLWSLLFNIAVFSAIGGLYTLSSTPAQQEQLLEIALESGGTQSAATGFAASEADAQDTLTTDTTNDNDADEQAAQQTQAVKSATNSQPAADSASRANSNDTGGRQDNATERSGGGRSSSAVATAPRLLAKTAPQYPAAARASGIQGRVVLSVRLSETGAITGITVKQSSGYAELDQAAAACLTSWRFAPAQDSSGRPVSCRTLIPVVFSLE